MTTITKTEHEIAIANAIVEQVRFRANLNYEVKLIDSAKSALLEFLNNQEFNDQGANVVFTNVIPEGYASASIANGDYVINVGFGKNTKKDKFPNVLYCNVVKTPEAKFRDFWRNRHLPISLLDEVMSKIDLTKPVEIVAYESARGWNILRKTDSENTKIDFVGQAPHEKTGSFVPSLPIGYVVPQSNKLVVTCPNEKLDKGRVNYMFH